MESKRECLKDHSKFIRSVELSNLFNHRPGLLTIRTGQVCVDLEMNRSCWLSIIENISQGLIRDIALAVVRRDSKKNGENAGEDSWLYHAEGFEWVVLRKWWSRDSWRQTQLRWNTWHAVCLRLFDFLLISFSLHHFRLRLRFNSWDVILIKKKKIHLRTDMIPNSMFYFAIVTLPRPNKIRYHFDFRSNPYPPPQPQWGAPRYYHSSTKRLNKNEFWSQYQVAKKMIRKPVWCPYIAI